MSLRTAIRTRVQENCPVEKPAQERAYFHFSDLIREIMHNG